MLKNKFMKYFNALLLLLMFSLQHSYANTVTVKGRGSVDYETGLFSSTPTKESEKSGIKAAKKSAWKKYIATFDGAKKKAYQLMKQEFISEINDYIVDYQVIDKKVDEDAATLTIVVRAEIDDTAVQNRLNINISPLSQSGQGEDLTFVFVTRAKDIVKKYQEKVTEMASIEQNNSAIEKISISGSGAASKDKILATTKKVTGGSTVKKRDKVKWSVEDSKDVDASMRKVLTNANYSPISYGEIQLDDECGGGPSLEEIRSEYASSISLSSKTNKGITKNANRCDIAYAAIGTLDVMEQNIDPVTGLVSVYVSVTAMVFDTRGRFAKTVGSVGPVQYQGLGPEETVARNNALAKAAQSAAETIVNQLTSKGIR